MINSLDHICFRRKRDQENNKKYGRIIMWRLRKSFWFVFFFWYLLPPYSSIHRYSLDPTPEPCPGRKLCTSKYSRPTYTLWPFHKSYKRVCKFVIYLKLVVLLCTFLCRICIHGRISGKSVVTGGNGGDFSCQCWLF